MPPSRAKTKPSRTSTVSKRERIRENQQRSRDRRKKHVAELERRVHEFEKSRKQDDVQKQAFELLQVENAQLRELLARIGVTDETVRSYIAQHSRTASAGPPNVTSSSLRPIKPKFSTSATALTMDTCPELTKELVSYRQDDNLARYYAMMNSDDATSELPMNHLESASGLKIPAYYHHDTELMFGAYRASPESSLCQSALAPLFNLQRSSGSRNFHWAVSDLALASPNSNVPAWNLSYSTQ